MNNSKVFKSTSRSAENFFLSIIEVAKLFSNTLKNSNCVATRGSWGQIMPITEYTWFSVLKNYLHVWIVKVVSII